MPARTTFGAGGYGPFSGSAAGSGMDLGDIFGSFFGGGSADRKKRAVTRENLHESISIHLKGRQGRGH